MQESSDEEADSKAAAVAEPGQSLGTVEAHFDGLAVSSPLAAAGRRRSARGM